MHDEDHDRYRRGGAAGAEAPPAEGGQDPGTARLRAPGGKPLSREQAGRRRPLEREADGRSGRPQGQGGGPPSPRGPVTFTLDINLLLYASDASSPFHPTARAFLDRLAEGPEIAYLFWPVISGYLRIATHPAVFTTPLSPEEAMANMDELLSLPHVQAPGEGERFWPRLREVSKEAGARGNMLPGWHRLARMRGNWLRRVWTHDRDYRRFDGVEV